MLPAFTVPNVAILLSWYRYNTIDTMIAAIEETARIAARKGYNLDSDSVGRICSSTARKLQAQRLACNPAYEQPFPNAPCS